MKKFIAVLLLAISMFSFFILYNEQSEMQISNMKNVEHHLQNSYEVTIPSKINTLPKFQQYKTILNTSNNQDSSIYLSRIDENNGQEKTIKYIYTTNNDYINKFHLVWGKPLDKTLMSTHYFLSTDDTGDKNQIGKIASFNGMHMEIHTLQSMLDDGLFLDGPCTVTVPNGKSINFFTNGLEDGIGIKTIDTSKPQDIDQVKSNTNNSYLQLFVLSFVIMLLVLYDILKSYKKIAVEKLLGFSTFHIWKKRILKITFIQIITMVISTIIMSLVLFKQINIYYAYFLEDLTIMYIISIVIMFIIASIPFIYVANIQISSAIKNKQPAKEILFFNTLVKIFLCLGLIFLVNNQIVNYKNIKKVFDGSYKTWESVSNYRVLGLNKDSNVTSFSDDDIKIYNYFNERGAIYAAFENYYKESLALNKKLPITSEFAMVNPNYLNENPVYDINGKKISISERDSNWILLVPVKYKKDEDKIRKFHQVWIDSFTTKRKIQIIWTKNNQKLFSYDFMVNADNGYCVTDPILFVGTEDGGFPTWNTQLFNVTGNPFKVKIDSNTTDTQFIDQELNKFGYLSYGPQINHADEEVNSNIIEYKNLFMLIIIGIISILLIMAIVLIQNIYNFFEQFKVKLAIRKLYGYKKMARYKEYFILIGVTWSVIIITAFVLSLAKLNIILIISVIGFIIETIVSFIMLNYIENKKIIEIIKGGA